MPLGGRDAVVPKVRRVNEEKHTLQVLSEVIGISSYSQTVQSNSRSNSSSSVIGPLTGASFWHVSILPVIRVHTDSVDEGLTEGLKATGMDM